VQKSTPKKIKARNPQEFGTTTLSLAAVKNQTLSNKNSKMSAILKNTRKSSPQTPQTSRDSTLPVTSSQKYRA
jgi:hypothetical protein